jgi:hypothetical protein
MTRSRLILVPVGALFIVILLMASTASADDTVTPMCNGRPCSTSPASWWYTTPVALTWQVSTSPPPDNTIGCAGLQPSPRNTIATDSCHAIWTGSDDINRTYTLHVELSNPSATVGASRPPDSNGWYNHPVSASVSGSAFSGIASCSGSTYAGPDSATAQLTGACVDNAGKTAGATTAISYDSTPPALQAVANPGDGSVQLRALASDVAPMAGIEIMRSPGLRHRKETRLHSGSGSFNDTRVRNGSRYEYTFIARDVAGNVAERTLTVVPGPRLLAPASGAVVTAPPVLRWTPVRHASYYNVQLYRGKKVLSLWPAHASLRLKSAWTFARRRLRLHAGRYHWFVWPGYGRRSSARYGHLIGAGTFVVAG